jgi:hypothetical protein
MTRKKHKQTDEIEREILPSYIPYGFCKMMILLLSFMNDEST